MDPSSFTKTSFCNIDIDNITTNESKKFILNQLSLLCSDIKYNSRYAKVFNDQFSKNLNNKHIFFLKSSGAPYLLFMSQINGINYSFFIDKKKKDGYDYHSHYLLNDHLSSQQPKIWREEYESNLRKHLKKTNAKSNKISADNFFNLCYVKDETKIFVMFEKERVL